MLVQTDRKLSSPEAAECADPRPDYSPLQALIQREEDLDAQKQLARLRTAMTLLSEREYWVIALRFGIACESLPMTAIAERLGVCRKTAYNIEDRAMRQLRLALGVTSDGGGAAGGDRQAA